MADFRTPIRKLMRLSLWGFGLVILLLSWWQVVVAPRLNAQPSNQRQVRALARVQPGRIYTHDNVLILGREREGAQWKPIYPQEEACAHVTGYNPQTGLQRGLRDALYGQGQFADPWRDLLRGEPVGNDVVLTIDSAAQRLATEEMEGRLGAVVALDPRDGAVLCLVSSPTYDPSRVLSNQEEYNLFRFDPDSPELNRSIQGLYPPGSAFKIFTAAAGVDLGVATPETEFSCAGEERVARARVVCRIRGGHGRLDLDEALWDSCNIAFAKLAQKIGIDGFIKYVKKLHVLDEADLALPSARGRMYDFRGFKGEVALSEAAFGQGETMLSPLQIARLTAAIANKGRVLQPYLLAEVRTAEKRVLLRGQAKDLGQGISRGTAAQVAGMMGDVVEKGTGRGAQLGTVTVAGKTGSAENPQGPAHGWFTCFAPAENPRVVVTVIVEGGGSGSGSALPIARRVLQELLEQ
jgi:peptidoglycan glycosyltransferase